MAPNDCPKFESCSAPVCPLDADWRLRTHINGERVCLWLTEAAKDDGEANLRGVLARELFEAVQASTPDILARWNPIRKAVERASGTGSRLASGKRLAMTRASPETPPPKEKREPLQRYAPTVSTDKLGCDADYTQAEHPWRVTR